MTVEPQKLWSDRAATKQQQIIKIKLNYAGILFSIKIIIWSYSTKLFSNLFYSIPNLNLQFIKGKACGNSRIYPQGNAMITNDKKRYLPGQFDLSLSYISQTHARWLVHLSVADTVVVLLFSGEHCWAYAGQQIPNLCSTAL